MADVPSYTPIQVRLVALMLVALAEALARDVPNPTGPIGPGEMAEQVTRAYDQLQDDCDHDWDALGVPLELAREVALGEALDLSWDAGPPEHAAEGLHMVRRALSGLVLTQLAGGEDPAT